MQAYTSKVLALFIADPDHPQNLPRDMLQLDPDGIIGDKHYAKEPSRSVLVTSRYAYDLAKREGIDIMHGQLGENILIDYDLRDLKPGDRLQMGETVLEIAQNCTLCNHLSKIDKRVPKLLRHDRGVFARVVRGGSLRRYDEVSLLK